MSPYYVLYRLLAAVIVAGFLAFPGPVHAQAAAPIKPEKGVTSTQTLSRGFEHSIVQLREDLKEWESRIPAAAADVVRTQKELDNLQVAVATVKATMVLERLSLLQVQELLESNADHEKGLKGKLKDLGQEIDDLKKSRQEQIESQNALRVQFSIIQAKDPAAMTPELRRDFLTYLNLAGDRERLQSQVLDLL
jgi:chromosome segregation ATPase